MDYRPISQSGSFHARRTPNRIARLLLVMGLCDLAGCATPEPVTVLPNREATIGKSKEALLACAGQPIRQTVEDQSIIFLYYKEAQMLQESFPGSKGSFPRPHYGCWASVLLEGDRVSDIGYQSVPSTIDAMDRCEAIFAACNPR